MERWRDEGEKRQGLTLLPLDATSDQGVRGAGEEVDDGREQGDGGSHGMVSAVAELMVERRTDCVVAVSINSERRESFFFSSSESRWMSCLR